MKQSEHRFTFACDTCSMIKKYSSSNLRKEQIILSCVDILETEDYQAVTIAEVAKRIGIVPSAIYKHIKNKDQMIEMVMNWAYGGLRDIYSSTAMDVMNPLERLKFILEHEVENRLYRETYLKFKFQGLEPNDNQDQEPITVWINSVLLSIIEEGVASNIIRRDIDPQSIVYMFVGLFMPVSLFNMLSGRREDLHKHVQVAWQEFEKTVKV